MVIRQIKLSSQAKERLSRLKSRTGIQNWNVLCRWALCYSLSEDTIPTDIQINSDSNVEMSWFTFGGEYNELYEALIRAWCASKSLPLYWRGIAHLSGTNFIKDLDDLLRLAIGVQNGYLS